MTSTPYEQWVSISDTNLTVDDVQNVLGKALDDLWVVAACVDRLSDNIPVQLALLQTGLSRTSSAVERCKNALAMAPGTSSDEPRWVSSESIIAHFRSVPADAQLCHFRSILLSRLDLLNSYTEIESKAPSGDDEVGDVEEDAEEEAIGREEPEDWDDPWAEDSSSKTTSANRQKKPLPMPFSLSQFMVNELVWSACRLASLEWFDALRVLMDRHGSYLWPLRLSILDNIPEYTHPSEFQSVVFRYDFTSSQEMKPSSMPWRLEEDFVESRIVQQAAQESGLEISTGVRFAAITLRATSHPEPLTGRELAAWFRDRVDRIISCTGMIDVALALVQHGASQGIPGLDEVGEELSLLSRLTYDTPFADEMPNDWTLALWHSMDPPAVVRAYLANSTPETVPQDILRLVLPYLFVLEARAERAGTPDPDIHIRLLSDYVLTSPLEVVASIFDASKPTLPAPQRIIRDDEDLARLALACLYGSNSLNEWSTMSRIFECLPAWAYSRDEENDEDAADTTIVSLGAFVAPTTTRPHASPTELMTFFKPLHIASLSRALDILDVHLEAGEILSRWNVPAPLKWFLQSKDDAKEQQAWANRMARRAGGMHDHLNTVEDWEWLLEDMMKLTGKNETGIGNAFGLLSEEEVMRVFLGGLLSTGSTSPLLKSHTL
jgi:hypothetical protein